MQHYRENMEALPRCLFSHHSGRKRFLYWQKVATYKQHC